MPKQTLIGQTSPDFTATDVFGNKVTLKGTSEGYTLLVFLRYSGCPWCNLAIHRLTIEHKMLTELKCRIITVVQSEETAIKENIYGRHDPKPQFPIIADHEMNFYKQFGVDPSVPQAVAQITKIPFWLESVNKLGFKQRKMDGSFFLVPAWFLLRNSDQEIIKTERGVSFYNHETFQPIYEALSYKY